MSDDPRGGLKADVTRDVPGLRQTFSQTHELKNQSMYNLIDNIQQFTRLPGKMLENWRNAAD